MIKRILSAIGTEPGCHAALSWSIEIARAHAASITVAPMLHPESWKESLPSVMTAGYAARVLERRPWEDSPIRLHDLEAWCGRMCAENGVECLFREPPGDPQDWLARLSGSHDLLVFSGEMNHLPELMKRRPDPVLAVKNEPGEIRSVLVRMLGAAGSTRALKQYVQLRLWPDAPLEVVCAHDDPDETGAMLTELARYCRAHEYTVRLTHVEGGASDLLEYVSRVGASLVIGEEFDATLLREDVPVFISR